MAPLRCTGCGLLVEGGTQGCREIFTALEHADDVRLRPALQRWLNGRSPITKPDLPDFRGSLTVADVQAAADPAGYERAVDAWTRDVWAAYAPLHALARDWIAGCRQ